MNKREQPSGLIIAAMIGLLKKRRIGEVRRIPFLKAWSRLRVLLAATRDYQLWREAVKERAGGACERCGSFGHHAHHKVPISIDPTRALDLSNGEYLCKHEHNEEHDGALLRPRRRPARREIPRSA